MQRFSIARSLRLALIGLTLALAVVAALGVSSLYNARQRYENVLVRTSSLATAAANLSSASIAEAEVLRDVRGPGAPRARREAAAGRRAAARGRGAPPPPAPPPRGAGGPGGGGGRGRGRGGPRAGAGRAAV